jgi:beta-lactamase class A
MIDWSGVTAAIGRAEAGGAVLGVCVVAPSGGRFRHNADRRFRAASTIKIAIMIALFRLVEGGTVSLDTVREVRAADKAAGGGVILHLHEGLGLTLGDLLYLMISISDNTATNMLIDVVGMDQVNAGMAALGMPGSRLGRKMAGVASDDAHENWAVPDEFAAVILALLGGRAGSAANCARMVAVLEQQQNTRRIARHLPKRDRPRWGSKTGSLEGVVNDVGFIMTASGPLVVSCFCEGVETLEGEAAIGEVARAALGCVG